MGTSSINDRGLGDLPYCHLGFPEEKALVPAFALQDDSRLFNPLGCMAENSGTGELEMLLVWFHSCGSYHPILISLKSWCDTRPTQRKIWKNQLPWRTRTWNRKSVLFVFFLIRNGWGFMLSHTLARTWRSSTIRALI